MMKRLKSVLLCIPLALSLCLSGCMSDSDSSTTSTEESFISSTAAITTTTEETTSAESTTAADSSEAIPQGSTFSVKYIDVGQADAALIECDGHYMLIDGGNKADSNVMYSVLKKEGASKLDIVVGTHAHEDHIGGLAGALNYATADIVLCPVTSYDSDCFADFKKGADKNGGITVPKISDSYALGSSAVKVIGVNGSSDVNNTSIVLKVTYGETSFLFSGDAERDAEQAILDSGADLSATVLKVGHHGSSTSTTYPYLREVMPKYAILSVGKDNNYGHPDDDTLSRLRDADVTVYRTDLNGDIVATSDGKEVTITTSKNLTAEETTAATETHYVVNTNTGKFHNPDCSSAKQIKEVNRMDYTGSRDDLIAQGYEPCGRCHP